MQTNRFIVIALVAVILESCKTTPPAVKAVVVPEPILLQIGNTSFTAQDFNQSFEKNRQTNLEEKPLSVKEYFDLYTHMKLKVLAAEQEGHDTTQNFKDEISSYREVLSKSYLTDKDLAEAFSKEAYERMKEEVHASHLLISVPELAAPEDTLEAYQAGMAMITRLQEGADFAEMAARFSKDPTAATNKGDLGYFSAFQMLYPFESAAYHTPVGQISGLTRTVHGYHILKIHERRRSSGKIQVAHCMVRTLPGANEAELNRAQQKIQEAWSKLESGEAWATVVAAYSEDKQSARNQGQLPVFGIGAMVKPFEEAAYDLQKPDQYSSPVRTEYGWHIIRLIRRIPLEPYEEAAPAIRQKVVTDTRGRLIDQQLYARLRNKYAIQENAQTQAALRALMDSTLLQGKWKAPAALPEDLQQATLFTIQQVPFSAGPFLEYLAARQRPLPAGSSLQLVQDRYYSDYLHSQLTAYEKDNLEANYPEFKELMTEIRDGVLLSKMMEKNVWEKSLKDTTEQRRLYERQADQYRYPERAWGLLVTAGDSAALNTAKRLLAVSPYALERKGPTLLFNSNESALSEELEEQLRDVVSVLSANPAYQVEVNTYREAEEQAETASNRLQEVVKFLTDHNVAISRIIEKNNDSFRAYEDAAQNRRVQFLYYTQSAQDVAQLLNKTAADAVSIKEGYLAKDDPLVSGFNWAQGEQTIADRWLRIERIEAPRTKTFAEARGAVINEYQQLLEKNWLDQLMQQFPVKVNEEELEKIAN